MSTEEEEEGEEQLSQRAVQLDIHRSCQESFLRSAARYRNQRRAALVLKPGNC